jgi:multidrug efflux pump subunit AcrA (membrane-fusion protein)
VISRFSRYLFLSALLLTAVSHWSCSRSKVENSASRPSAGLEDAIAVKAAPVEIREWIASVPISGNLLTLSSVDVKPEVGGRLMAAYYKEGDLVRKNQLLAEIDPENYRLAYDQAAAALAVAQAGLERAKVSAEHAKTTFCAAAESPSETIRLQSPV